MSIPLAQLFVAPKPNYIITTFYLIRITSLLILLCLGVHKDHSLFFFRVYFQRISLGLQKVKLNLVYKIPFSLIFGNFASVEIANTRFYL